MFDAKETLIPYKSKYIICKMWFMIVSIKNMDEIFSAIEDKQILVLR